MEKYYDSTLTGEELDAALRDLKTNVARSETAVGEAEALAGLAQSYAVGQGAPEKHPEEETDNARYYAGQAKASAESAAGSAQVVADNREGIQAIVINLQAILAAAENALAAQSAAEDAAASAETAQEAADRAQSIAQGQLGYYPTAARLQQDYPEGQNGQWAIIGDTDTIWVWDSDSGAWTDSGNKTDLSQYYTKDQTDQQINELQTAMNKALTDAMAALSGQVDTKLAALQAEVDAAKALAQAAASRSWTVEVPAAAWQDGAKTVTYGSVSFDCKYKADLPCAGMMAAAVLSAPEFAGGDLAAMQTWAEAEPGAGTVTLWSETKPEAAFTVRFVEVK